MGKNSSIASRRCNVSSSSHALPRFGRVGGVVAVTFFSTLRVGGVMVKEEEVRKDDDDGQRNSWIFVNLSK